MFRSIWFGVFCLGLLLGACIQGDQAAISSQSSPAEKMVTQAAVQPTRQPGCTVVTRQPTPGPTQQSLFPPAGEEDWARGPADASITLVEYADFQCPGCAAIDPFLKRLVKSFPEDVRWVYRHFPLSNHDKAAIAVQAAEAAGRHGKFWEMRDLLFDRRAEWVDLNPDQFQSWVLDRAAELNLGVDQFAEDFASQELATLAQEAWEKNSKILYGTPFILVNGFAYNGPLDYSNLEATVKMILLERKQFSECPQMVINLSKQYFATLHTEKGDILLELYADQAPLAVNNFVFLARQGWYDGTTFHRVIPGYIAQAGDPSGTGFGGPGYAFDNEISPRLKFDRPGVLGMANAGPGSNGSQFFITYTATPNLNGGYTIFGQLISGMDVLLSLKPRDPSVTLDLPPGDLIIRVTIEEK